MFTPYELGCPAGPADAGPPNWEQWEQLGLPAADYIEFRLSLLCPEAPQLAQMAALIGGLETAIGQHGAHQAVLAFLAAADDTAALLDRRALLVFLAAATPLRILPRLPLPARLRPASSPGPRPLRPMELALLRAEGSDPRRRILLRLLNAGLTEHEAAILRTSDVHLQADGQVWVRAPGARGIRPRTLALPRGANEAIQDRLAEAGDGYLLALDVPDDATHVRRAKTVHQICRRMLARTGLDSDPSASPGSIRLGMLALIRATHGLETAATVAGTTSLSRLQAQLAG